MKNILVIKTSASGDVVRTSVLLHILKGKIFWITKAYNIPLFPDNYPDLVLIAVENIGPEVFSTNFDIIVNLEEDPELAKKVATIRTKRTIGIFWSEGKLQYTPDSAEWFDMSLVSIFSSIEADNLKKKNQSSYQEILYRMLGENFSGEKYLIYRNNKLARQDHAIGIEHRVGRTWPNKNWHGYEDLIDTLNQEKQIIKVFEKRVQLRQYLDDINECELIVCGDTLAMHVAMAYDIPCIAIFNCTSSNEIFDYGHLTKMISPLLFDAFYKLEYDTNVIRSIPLQKVYDAVTKQIGKATGSLKQ